MKCKLNRRLILCVNEKQRKAVDTVIAALNKRGGKETLHSFLYDAVKEKITRECDFIGMLERTAKAGRREARRQREAERGKRLPPSAK